MTLHYRISDPSDVRDLGNLPSIWAETGNQKGDDWAEQPEPPTPDAVWRGPDWIILDPAVVEVDDG